MILLLDNYDSFVHNLARYLRRLGQETVVIRSDEIDVEGCNALRPNAILISPGPHRPEQAGCSVDVIQNTDLQIPILGVCLGHQAIAVAFGGSVVQCDPMHGMSSQIQHAREGIFAKCPTPMSVGRYHSLAVETSSLPDDLVITATSMDDQMIMGIQHRQRPIYGVQFHPESVLSEGGMKLLDSFVQIASKAREEVAS